MAWRARRFDCLCRRFRASWYVGDASRGVRRGTVRSSLPGFSAARAARSAPACAGREPPGRLTTRAAPARFAQRTTSAALASGRECDVPRTRRVRQCALFRADAGPWSERRSAYSQRILSVFSAQVSAGQRYFPALAVDPGRSKSPPHACRVAPCGNSPSPPATDSPTAALCQRTPARSARRVQQKAAKGDVGWRKDGSASTQKPTAHSRYTRFRYEPQRVSGVHESQAQASDRGR